MEGGAVGAFEVPTVKMQPLEHGAKVLVLVDVVVGIGVEPTSRNTAFLPLSLAFSCETCILIASIGPLQKLFAAE